MMMTSDRGHRSSTVGEDFTINRTIFDRWSALCLILPAMFMFWAARQYTVFDDEAFSCLRYTLPPGEMVSALWHGEEPDPPLYYLLQAGWIRLFGVGPLGLRSLSILLFLVGLIFIRLAGQEWIDPRTGRVAMLLCALHPAHLFFGFAGRWYSAMFCAVAVLLWLTGRLLQPLSSAQEAPARLSRASTVMEGTHDRIGGRGFSRYLFWSIAAAAVCYTNYFGPVVVGLIWLVAMIKSRFHRNWLLAGILAATLYLPWLPPFWRQLTTFPQVGGSILEYTSTLARTLVALSAGNLASPRAWWVWVPMAMFAVCIIAILAMEHRRLWPFALIAMGCLIAGTLSRTMIDKYVMTFSGVLWLAIAGCLVSPPVVVAHSKAGYLRRLAVVSLCLAWLGCGVNVFTERCWSSLRWLDPFPRAMTDLRGGDFGEIPSANMVLPHPSARYYFACQLQNSSSIRILPAEWRSIASTSDNNAAPGWPGTVQSVLHRINTDPPQRIAMMETSGFSDDPALHDLDVKLNARYKLITERSYLDDPDAELKNQLDPRYTHPTQRIRVRVWQRAP